MRFTDICKTYIDRADISLSHQMDFETYLRNHAQEIINLVEAAEQAMEHANFYVEADKEDDPLTRACTYGGMVSSIIDVLNPALAALNKEPPKEIDPNKWAFDRKLESY